MTTSSEKLRRSQRKNPSAFQTGNQARIAKVAAHTCTDCGIESIQRVRSVILVGFSGPLCFDCAQKRREKTSRTGLADPGAPAVRR